MDKRNDAIELFGEEIVDKLERQHQDGYPNIFQRTYYSQWNYGDTAKYIIELDNKKYEVTMEDNVLKDPLWINKIIDIKEI